MRRRNGATRIEVVTEGILTRRLQGDPSLEEVGLVIFDEFHERSLDADLGLALALAYRRTSEFKFAGAVPFLAAFGILHGIHEWYEMFQIPSKR